MDIATFNAVPAGRLTATLLACCDAPAWAASVRDARPYADGQELLGTADRLVRALTDHEVEQALAAHPRLGEQPGGRDTGAAWSRQEQSGVARSGEDQVAEVNRAYEERFGRIFLISASGMSAAQIVDAARTRLRHDDATEATVVREELRKIVLLRLRKVLQP